MRQTFCAWLFLSLALPMLGEQGQSASAAKAAPDYSQESVVVEQLSTKIVFEADGTSKQESTSRIRMQSNAGVQQFGVISIPYAKANGDVDIIYVRVRKPDGSVVVTPEENTQEMPAAITREAPFYSDLREKQVAVRGLAVGDVLEFQVRSGITKPQVPGQFWYEHSFLKDSICKDEQLEIRVPKEKYVKVKSPEVQPSVREEGGYRVYSWKASNLEVKQKDGKKKQQQQTALGNAEAPSLELTTFRSWEELGRWYEGLQRDRTAVTPDIQAKAQEITKGLSNENEKLQAIYRYVSSQFRYVGLAFGIGRFQPHAASDVLANGYGDCKDKHTLLAALAKAAGIEVRPALVNASRKLDADIPSPTQFNHLISVAGRGPDRVWLDTTLELAPFGLLTANVRDKEALVMFPDQPAVLARTPADPPFPSNLTFDIEGKLGSDGVLHARITRTARGDFELLLRLAYRRTPRSQWKELTQQLSYMSNFAGEVSNVEVGSPEDTTQPFRVAYDYLRKDYPDWSNRRVSPPLPPLLPALADDAKWSEDEFLGAPGEITYRAKIELPQGYNATKLADVEVKAPFAQYRASYDGNPGTLLVERRLTIVHGKIKEAEWETYRKFCKQVADDRDMMVNANGGEPKPGAKSGEAAAQAPAGEENKGGETEGPQASKLADKAREAMQSQNWQAALEYMQQVVAIDEKYPGAWLTLGGLAAMHNRRDEAVEDFQKEIQFHPDSPRAYRALAEYQIYLKRTKDALETYRRWEKVAPDDAEVIRRLGQFLLDEKQYGEAIPYLERAAGHDPDNATVQLLLGSAYLAAGDRERGKSRLAKATELDPSPNMLNNVAYSLAESPADIPRALEYGKKAVAAVEAQSQSVSLAELKMSDLNRMGFLAAYWDTVGWIYFKSNDLEKAESYLKSAWTLSEGSTEGDHLAQVYEKKGDFAAAGRTYELALERGAGREAQQRLDKVREKVPAERPKLLKKAGPVQSLPVSPGEELSRMRTTRIGQVPGVKNGTAEFFLLLADGGAVQAVKFIKGKEELRAAEKAILTSHFDEPLPPGSQAKIIRRGFLSCSEYIKGCDFVVLTPEMVKSLQ